MTHVRQTSRGSSPVPPFDRASVADVMSPGVIACAPAAPLVTVAQTLAAHHVHSVVVVGLATDAAGGDHLVWGVVSDMDLVRAAGSGIEGRTAADAARTGVVTVDPSTSLAEAARLMDEHGTAHLIVTGDGQPIGVVSSFDIAGALAQGRE